MIMDAPLYRHHREVAFADTDAGGWVHFPNILRYVEEAEHAFLKSKGVLVFDRALGGWPRVNVNCDFAKPLQFGDRVEVQLAIAQIGNSSVTWKFEIQNEVGECVAQGDMTTVRVDHEGHPQALSELDRSALSSP
jgi:YbgC/YbaW family acyl-CoA thioester hydrolase